MSNPGNARWCAEHKRLECTKNRSKGRGPCHAAAIRGTNTCKNHGGHSIANLKLAGEARITAWSPFGEAAKPVSAPMAVLGVLQMSWLRLGAYSELLRRQVAAEQDLSDEDAFIGLDPDASQPDELKGLIGYRYGAAGKDGTIYTQSEELRALVVLEAAERDRVVKYAKTAHDMGISDKMIQLAERWGDVVAGRIAVMLDALGLSPEQSAMVPALLQLHLGSIDVEALSATPEGNGR